MKQPSLTANAKRHPQRASVDRPSTAAGPRTNKPLKIAIVATHGVIPQAQYGFGDEVASALRGALNAAPGAGPNDPKHAHGKWEMSVVFPSVVAPTTASAQAPTSDLLLAQKPHIVRVYRQGDDPEAPAHDFFDIHEAYWSPIDKGRTSAASVVAWLVRTVFLPFNDVARYMAPWYKAAWDAGFILIALVLGLTLLGGAFLAFSWCLTTLNDMTSPSTVNVHPPMDGTFPFVHVDFKDALAYVVDPTKLATTQTLMLMIGAGGAYLFAQGVHAFSSIFMNWKTLTQDAIQAASRIVATLLLFALSAAGLVACARHFAGSGKLGELIAVALVATFVFVKGGQSLAFWFIANFFGDVQIYTTRDNNSAFFVLRQAILAVVTRTIIEVIQTPPDQPDYDRVYVFAHSLGSTISLDALIAIANMRREGLVTRSQYEKLRGFVTFGTALEKTKYFFDVWSPTFSQQYDEWRNDIYGSLFTAEKSALSSAKHTGIYWHNIWYFSDFVADEISSYRSLVAPDEPPSCGTRRRASLRDIRSRRAAERVVARNSGRFGPFKPWKAHFVTHGDYLGDPWFWNGQHQTGGVLDIVTTDLSSVSTR